MPQNAKIGIFLSSLAGAAVTYAACSSTQPPPAAAQAPALDVATEPCTAMMPSDAGGPTLLYAAHAYPGLSAAQLSQVRAIGHIASGGSSPLGYAYGVPRDQANKNDAMFVGDGSVAVVCGDSQMVAGQPVTVAWYDTVTFTRAR